MKRLGTFLKEWMSVICVIVFVLLFSTYVGNAAYIPSESMVPTLHVHDVVGVNKAIDPQEDLAVGDVVVFYPPLNERSEELFIKRLIGKGGDTIEIRDGVLIRNGEPVVEPYLREEKMNYQYGPITVPEGKFFFLGDNRNESLDSHLWPTPFVEEEKIVGKAQFKMYPFDEIGSGFSE
ncbi:signal peptidase I [Tumebacillus sp. DT12]|uniref:Signal peptidase I n=1 Tax=Tumebacillus lacus TaxID=2995335 RepID=A0ABT3X8U8_9BACL|nr:signal peptidase I [Tumebacillus lacus]MCX7572035.1 signal peptidase I [Tumebacillus lacus]